MLFTWVTSGISGSADLLLFRGDMSADLHKDTDIINMPPLRMETDCRVRDCDMAQNDKLLVQKHPSCSRE